MENNKLLTTAEQLREEIMADFTWMHAHPELSWHERETTAYLSGRLEALGWETTTFAHMTGLTAVRKDAGNAVRNIALRADLDALWQQVDQKWQAVHSCGHDAHATIVLGAVRVLEALGHKAANRLKLILQPAEEVAQGALKMLETGELADIDYLYGLHLRPHFELANALASPAIRHGATMTIEGRIHGLSAHAAKPHLGTNVIEVAGQLIQALGFVRVDPLIPASVKMTRLKAGGDSTNIVPDYAEFVIDIRAENSQAIQQLQEQISRAAKAVADQFSARIELSTVHFTLAPVNSPRAEALMRKAIGLTLGEKHIAPPVATSGGEDFHFYRSKRPDMEATMLGLGCGLTPGLHHPQMTFDREVLIRGAAIMAQAVIETDRMTGGAGDGADS